LIGLIIFFSATQLGLHFWPLSSLVYGIRIDYLSPTIYFLDCLIVLFLVIKSSDLIRWSARSDSIGVFAPLLLTNLLYSANPLATLSWSFHFVIYFLFIKALCGQRAVLERNSWLQAKKGSSADERTVLTGTISSTLTLSLLFQAVLATIQVCLGHSLGGLLYYLGERNIAVGSPNIALGTFMDHVVLRAYGTFSHPNILAGYGVVALLIIIQLSKQRAVRGSDLKGSAQPRIIKRGEGQTLWVLMATILASLLVLLTQSRSAAIALFGIILPFYLLKTLRIRFIYYFVGLLVCWFIYPSSLSPARSDLSAIQRIDLQHLSLTVIKSYPIFGTGASASISTYPAVPQAKPRGIVGLQPDHNSFTLFLSWFGIFGVIAILQLIPCTSSAIAREKCLQTLCSLGGLLPLLLLDHYLLTSPQGLFILLLYFTVAVNYSHVQKNRQQHPRPARR